ncbi:MAG: CRISPR-associated endonuclease Cas3'', partial [Myxococcales bacterium]|nr:CRISPR-associated endonuclease Cas3'' [Myxococcales bacterium]
GTEGPPSADLQPHRSELCSVPVERARAWLLGSPNDPGAIAAFVWDYVSGSWVRLRYGSLYPGQTILVGAAAGGYDVDTGFTGVSAKRGSVVPTLAHPPELTSETRADLASARDDVSVYPYKTIATHGQEAATVARTLGRDLGLPTDVIETLVIAAALHDIGKSHPAFQYACSADKRDPQVRDRQDLAKAPNEVWRRGVDLFSPPGALKRRGFRHELVSVLMLFEWLRQTDPMHDALLGPHVALIEAGLLSAPPDAQDVERAPFPLAGALDAAHFDLVAYLICAHHGKIRGVWSSTPQDQEVVVRDPSASPLRGVFSGDRVPSVVVGVSDELEETAPGMELSLELAEMGLSARYGRSWTDRVMSLVTDWGPTTLAYLEALIRVADTRASRLATVDARLGEGEAS